MISESVRILFTFILALGGEVKKGRKGMKGTKRNESRKGRQGTKRTKERKKSKGRDI